MEDPKYIKEIKELIAVERSNDPHHSDKSEILERWRDVETAQVEKARTESAWIRFKLRVFGR